MEAVEQPRKRGREGFGGGKKGKAPNPPKMLVDMRKAYRGAIPEDAKGGLLAVKNLLEANPKEFLARLAQLERDWKTKREALKELAKGQQPSEGKQEKPKEEAKDAGAERALGLIERILREANDGADLRGTGEGGDTDEEVEGGGVLPGATHREGEGGAAGHGVGG